MKTNNMYACDLGSILSTCLSLLDGQHLDSYAEMYGLTRKDEETDLMLTTRIKAVQRELDEIQRHKDIIEKIKELRGDEVLEEYFHKEAW